MELAYFVNLIFIFSLNMLFFLLGTCLNSLVIISFLRSVQLRKKLCYFMIMVLSCCDLLVVLTYHPLLALFAMLRLTKMFDAYPSWALICTKLFNIFPALSLLALLVMNFDRYLATYYPIKHRTSVTKGKLITLLATLIVVELTLCLMSIKDSVIPHSAGVLTCLTIICPPMLFTNYKLFTIARKRLRNHRISPEMKKTFSWKNISSCLLALASFVVLSVPVFVYSVLRIGSKDKDTTFDDAELVGLSARTIASMNSTFNCLIFYWKNKILRMEGMKVIKSVIICRNVQS